jgi:DNA anti-recombination protein RmuC
MNTTVYATILTGLGILITLIVTMVNVAKTNQQETNRRIDDLKQDAKRWIDETNRRIDEAKQETNRRIDETNRRIDEAKQETNRRIDELRQDLLGAVDSKSKVTDAQFEVVGVRFQKLEEDVGEVRQEVLDLKKVIFKTAA